MPHRDRNPRHPPTGSMDALEFLQDDNRKLRQLFRAIKKMTHADQQDDKRTLIKQVCHDLLIHMALEETIFYPALRSQSGDDGLINDGLINEAQVEHDCARTLIHDLQRHTLPPMGEARLNVLCDYLEHHVRDKENRMFPRALAAQIDLQALGRQLATTSARLQAEHRLAGQPNDA